jgi:hypothetical protein
MSLALNIAVLGEVDLELKAEQYFLSKGIFLTALWLNSWALSSLFGYLLAIPVTFSALVSDSLYPFASRPIAMPPLLSHDELLEEGR